MNHDETNLPEKKPEMQTWIEPELEARIVAWVAGEASAFEVAELERLVAEKPELAIFKRRIEAVHGLVGEAARKDRAPLRMADERRAKLLETLRSADAAAATKTETQTSVVVPMPAPKLPRWKRDWWIVGSTVAAACVAFVAFLPSERSWSTREAAGLPDPAATYVGTNKAVTPLELVAGKDYGKAEAPALRQLSEREAAQASRAIGEAQLKLWRAESRAQSPQDAKTREVADYALVTAAPQSPMPELIAGAAMSAPPAAPAPALAPPAELMKKPFADKSVAFDTNALIGQEFKPGTDATINTGGFHATSVNETSAANQPAATSGNNIRLFGPGVQALGGIYAGNSFVNSTGSATFGSEGATIIGAVDGRRLVTPTDPAASVPANQFSFNNSIQSGGGGAAAGAVTFSGAGAVTFGAAPMDNKKTVTLGDTVADMELKPRQVAPFIGGTVSGSAVAQTISPEAQALARADAPVVLDSFAVTAERAGYAAASQVSRAPTKAEDRDVGYLAGGTTGTTSAASNEVFKLEAFEITSAQSAKRRPPTSTAKAPAPPTPTVARARTTPNQPAPVATSLPAAPAAAPVAALSLPALAVPSPANSPATPPPSGSTAALGLVSLDSRKDFVNDELKAANLEAVRKQLEDAAAKEKAKQLEDAPLAKPAPAPVPPIEETSAAKEPMSTFSLHVSDVSFRLAAAALARGEVPDAARIRAEEFYNAFDYGDPAPTPAEKVSCRIEQSAHPFAQQRNLVRIAMKVGATGRGAGTPLRLTVLLDTSGSMEREDRHATVQRAMEVLVSLLGPNDRITLVGFARTPRLLAENLAGNQAGSLLEIIARTPPDGGTNLEEALKLAGELARRHRDPAAQNRIVMLTDGAANLGNAEPASLATAITTLRQQGIAFDACGVGLDGLDDDILESLTRSGDGRYYALNSPADADAGFAQKLAGAFRPAAENVKLQVRFNAARVGAYRLIGFEQHRLRAEDFRNDKVDAAELAAEEAAVALYQVEALPSGDGELGEVFVRFRDPATGNMVERSWPMNYDARAAVFDRASPTMQLAGTAALLAEKLRGGAPASQVRLAELAPVVNSLRTRYANVPRVQELATMYAQMRRVTRE